MFDLHLAVDYHGNLCRNSFLKLEPWSRFNSRLKENLCHMNSTFQMVQGLLGGGWNMQLHSAAAGHSQIESCEQVDLMAP